MSILICGMELPKSCGFCPMRFESDIGDACLADSEVVTEYQKRPDDCPLVPVPPHGRLIDADALPWENQGLMLTDQDEWGLKAQDIENAPTIIPADLAEEGKT